MKKIIAVLFVVAGGVLFATASDTPVPVPAGTVSPSKLAPAEITAEREKYMKEVLASIKGRTKEPAEAVFKNIQRLKGVPAGRLLAIMNFGYGRSLGVSCTHCHTPGEWDKEDKPEKQIARDMGAMSAKINKELLPAIKGLDSSDPVVNCTTCHRGEIKPALDLPELVVPPPAAPAAAKP